MTTDTGERTGTSLDDTVKISSPADTGFPVYTHDASNYQLVPSSDDVSSHGTTTVGDRFEVMFAKAFDDIKGTQTADPLWSYRFSEFLNTEMRAYIQALLLNRLLAEGNSAVHSTKATYAILGRDYLATETSTDIEPSSADVEEKILHYIQKIANDSVDEVFIDGMESDFSRRLTVTLESYGKPAVGALERLIELDSSNVELVGEILRQVGEIEDLNTHQERLTLLTRNLDAPDPRIRDAAALGLASLDDPKAIDDLLEAWDRERYPQLKGNLRMVLDQLQYTRWPNS